jgi:hypothetical protein
MIPKEDWGSLPTAQLEFLKLNRPVLEVRIASNLEPEAKVKTIISDHSMFGLNLNGDDASIDRPTIQDEPLLFFAFAS